MDVASPAQFAATNVEGADLLLSALFCASRSNRRATVCKPFPTRVLPSQGLDHDYTSLSAELQAVRDLLDIPEGSKAAQLLHWLFFERNRGRTFQPLALHSLDPHLTHCCGWPPDPHNPSLHPSLVLQLSQPLANPDPPHAADSHTSQQAPAAHPTTAGSSDAPPEGVADLPAQAPQRSPAKSLLAFHGTAFENLHSILHSGLLSASGTTLQRHGNVFGNGIYFSSDYRTAYGFSSPGPAWPRSRLGSRLRCVLVCELDVTAQSLGSKVLTGLQPGGEAGGSSLPQTYWLVKSPDAVQLRYILVYRDAPPAAAAPLPSGAAADSLVAWLKSVNWVMVLPILYAVAMVLIGLRS